MRAYLRHNALVPILHIGAHWNCTEPLAPENGHDVRDHVEGATDKRRHFLMRCGQFWTSGPDRPSSAVDQSWRQRLMPLHLLSPDDAGGPERVLLWGLVIRLRDKGHSLGGILSSTTQGRKRLHRISACEERVLQLNDITDDVRIRHLQTSSAMLFRYRDTSLSIHAFTLPESMLLSHSSVHCCWGRGVLTACSQLCASASPDAVFFHCSGQGADGSVQADTGHI